VAAPPAPAAPIGHPVAMQRQQLAMEIAMDRSRLPPDACGVGLYSSHPRDSNSFTWQGNDTLMAQDDALRAAAMGLSAPGPMGPDSFHAFTPATPAPAAPLGPLFGAPPPPPGQMGPPPGADVIGQQPASSHTFTPPPPVAAAPLGPLFGAPPPPPGQMDPLPGTDVTGRPAYTAAPAPTAPLGPSTAVPPMGYQLSMPGAMLLPVPSRPDASNYAPPPLGPVQSSMPPPTAFVSPGSKRPLDGARSTQDRPSKWGVGPMHMVAAHMAGVLSENARLRGLNAELRSTVLRLRPPASDAELQPSELVHAAEEHADSECAENAAETDARALVAQAEASKRHADANNLGADYVGGLHNDDPPGDGGGGNSAGWFTPNETFANLTELTALLDAAPGGTRYWLQLPDWDSLPASHVAHANTDGSILEKTTTSVGDHHESLVVFRCQWLSQDQCAVDGSMDAAREVLALLTASQTRPESFQASARGNERVPRSRLPGTIWPDCGGVGFRKVFFSPYHDHPAHGGGVGAG